MNKSDSKARSASEAAEAHAGRRAYQPPVLTGYGKVTELVKTGTTPVPVDIDSAFAT